MSDVLIPGGRDVRGTLEEPGDADPVRDGPESIVVACPPHPQHGGSRSDGRLVAVAAALTDAGIACLRFDYGSWDEGYGERADVRNAVRWAADRYDRVGLFGYSFGATLALLAAADLADATGGADPADDATPAAVAALAPTARLADDLDALEALAEVSVPLFVGHGERDSTVEWEPIVERARERDDEVRSYPADHFFVAKHGDIGSDVAAFFERTLLEG
ncbi:dienelactone hydrolase family protein [Halopiger goleimassiliensis]|uniref:dienelactone hydrolase family protein n=1 Tax=Halopiger goleimassiliensis TaxID=1293048 RepID=UPI00067758BD|nr:dienelactone hydrolase family protein [Halopiger goleimassiliensis]